MIVRLGDHAFDDVLFDSDADVLYMSRGKPVAAAMTLPSPEGHAIRFNDADEIIGITIVNARWLAERDGRIMVTIPDMAPQAGCLETSAEDLAPALAV